MHVKTGMVVIALILLASVANASDSKEALVIELYGKSGMEEQILQLPKVIELGFDQAVKADENLQKLRKGTLEAIRAGIGVAFDPKHIKNALIHECIKKLDTGDLKKVLEWLDSPLGRKFTRLEEAASKPEQFEGMQRYAAGLKKSPPGDERIEKLKKLDASVKATDTNIDVVLNTQMAVAMAITATLPLERQPPRDELISKIEQTRPQVEQAMRMQTLVSFLYTYRNVTDKELDEYIKFASSQAGKHYHGIVISGLKKAMMAGAYKWGEITAEILQQSSKRTDA